MKKIIIATDSFKGSLSAKDATCIIAREAETLFPVAEVTQLPIADGGEGLVETLIGTLKGEVRWVDSQDPLGRPLQASYALLDDSSALIEMAAAGGLTLLRPEEYDPLQASTVGVGQLIRDAIEASAGLIFVGLGGSATIDGGVGAASVIGIRFLDQWGRVVTTGGGLSSIVEVGLEGLRALGYQCKLVFLTDVNNPLCGLNGAAAIFGPQKGASPEQVRQLGQGLEHLAAVVAETTGLDLKNIPGMGAAGGFALPFVAFMGAEMRSGIDFVLDLLEFDQKLIGADLVITGEGRTDAQSAMGKAISEVARRARDAGVRVAVISGALGEGAERMFDLGVTDLVQATPEGQPLEEALSHAAENLATAARNYFNGLKT